MDRTTILLAMGAAIIAAPMLWQSWQEASAGVDPHTGYSDCLRASFETDGKKDGDAIGYAYEKCAPQVADYRNFLATAQSVDPAKTEKLSQRVAEVSYARFAGLTPGQVVGCFKKNKKKQTRPMS
ncbi:MAG: hypothetical protein O3A84_03700 [Proteobacteria bacterium]|nr:hypothetical protein [Pseudomonadota bacterium]